MMKGRSELDHVPVLADEVVDQLITNPIGAYLDLTAGLGGHLVAMSHRLEKEARLYGIDRDEVATIKALKNLEGTPQLREIVNASYRDVDVVVDRLNDKSFDGILLDLGISSLQLDDAERGFSFRFDGPLDMRFDQSSHIETAAELINRLDQRGLAEIISRYGEERKAMMLAEAIVRERRKGMLNTTTQLAAVVNETIRPPHQTKSLARVFQAFRIAVNHELEHLEDVLPKATALLAEGGRLVVISYHSLEDRLVKRFMQSQVKPCVCPPRLPVCVCNRKQQLELVTRKAIVPSIEEQERNPRARSAKMRVAARVAK